jgi:hypothetical protein
MKKSKAAIPNTVPSIFQNRCRDATSVIQKPFLVQILFVQANDLTIVTPI